MSGRAVLKFSKALEDLSRFDRLQLEYFANADTAKFAWQTSNAYMAKTERELLDCVPIRERERFLEVGCGEGGNLRLMSKAPTTSIGIDFSFEKVRWARRSVSAGFLCADGTRLPFRDGSFDVILCRDVLHHVTDKSSLVGELVRVCAPSGRLVVIEPNGRSLIMWLLGMVVPAERDLVRNSLQRLTRLLHGRSLSEPTVIWAQPFPLGRVLFHYRWGLPGLAALFSRAVLAVERAIGKIIPSERWAYLVIIAEKSVTSTPVMHSS